MRIRIVAQRAIAAAFVASALALAPGLASACPGQEGGCAEKAGCGGCEHAAADKADGAKADCKCDKAEGADCACKGDCPAKDGATCPHGDDKKACDCGKDDASCPCKGDCPAKKGGECPHANKGKAEGGCQGEGASQKAVIDPATGALVEPAHGEGAGVAAAPAARAADAPKEVPQPHGGTMAAFPKDRASHLVATVDASGAAHANCGHAAK